MKRIFLTSGLVLCMACPAFADLTANGTVAPGTDPATCQEPTLDGYNGTSTFTAKWTQTFKTITINSNIGETAEAGGVTTLTPTPLYSVPSIGKVWTGLDTNQNLTGGINNAGISSDGLVLTNNPMVTDGILVNYTLNANGGELGSATSTGDNRPFLGVYDQAGTTQYITAAGVLTDDGATAAGNNTGGTTWYAQYDTVTPTVNGTPTKTGYTFVGWNTTQSATEALQSFPAIADNNTTLYAIWQAIGYTITYDCGQPSGASTDVVGPVTETQNVTMDGSYELAGANNCTLDGYTFAGWSCPNLPGDGTPNFDAGATGTYSYAGNVTCTAQWTPNTINLVWDNNNATSGGTGGGSTCTFDGEIDLPTVPTRTGYEFGGWQVVNTSATQQSGGGNE